MSENNETEWWKDPEKLRKFAAELDSLVAQQAPISTLKFGWSGKLSPEGEIIMAKRQAGLCIEADCHERAEMEQDLCTRCLFETAFEAAMRGRLQSSPASTDTRNDQ